MAKFPHTRVDMWWPTLKALEKLGGSATNGEIKNELIEILDISDDDANLMKENGSGTVLGYRAGWSRTGLKSIGAINNTERGVWTITEKGRNFTSEDSLREAIEQRERQYKDRSQENIEDENFSLLDENDSNIVGDSAWIDELLEIIRNIEPSAFERLCQLILRESGFTKVEVTGRPGDGGIDGTGILRVNLVSFSVIFQCKRYSGSVGVSDIRNFRGAMRGQDKGLFMTTGRFTKDAEKDAVKVGAPSIDLIDGEDICRLLKDLKLGVKIKTIDVIEPNREFFQNI